MSETKFKKDVCYALEELGFHTTMHEHKREGIHGTPDVSYGQDGINGWIEFKWGLEASIRTSQRIWLDKRSVTGGHCFVLWGTTRWVYMIPWEPMMRLSRLTEDALAGVSHQRWDPKGEYYWEYLTDALLTTVE